MQFLSMKLTAASSFYDFNSETDDLETMQVRASPHVLFNFVHFVQFLLDSQIRYEFNMKLEDYGRGFDKFI
jgi:hypothetical protein